MTIVKLSRSYAAHGKSFDSVELREPKLRDHLAVGDPVEMHPGPDGEGRFIVEHNDRILAYLGRLAVEGKPGREMLDDLDLVDSMALKDAIVDFFISAHRRKTALTNSSSASDSPST